MSHAYQREFIDITKSLFPEMFMNRRVLEIGSLDVNGSIRRLFEKCDYTGLDIAPGPGVDIVCEGQNFDGADGSFDVVLSCEVMEHNPFWQATLSNMIRLLKPEGMLIMSCATRGRPEHGTARCEPSSSPPTVSKGWNYYRNLTARDFLREVDLSQMSSYGFATNLDSWDLYMLGVKAGGSTEAAERIAKFKAIYHRRIIPSLGRRLMHGLTSPSRIPGFLSRYF